jgi:hypothetical protein
VGGGDEWSVIIPSYELPNIQWNLKWKVCTRNEKVGQGKKDRVNQVLSPSCSVDHVGILRLPLVITGRPE